MAVATMLVLFAVTGAAPVSDAVSAGRIGGDGFSCVVGDNQPWGEAHRAGYNGVFLVEGEGLGASPFVPQYAGLNLEHYFDLGPRSPDDAVFFEPRRAPMTFASVDALTAELRQAATPHYGVESVTRFEVTAPGRLDMTFSCTPRKAGLEGGVLGVFWASYINAPEDKSVYFPAAGSKLDAPVWVQYATQAHGRDSTVLSERDTRVFAFQGGEGTLFNNLSPLRYGVPFFYGRHGDSVLIFVFEPDALIRFSHSPSGGGKTPAGDGFNPAWDFQYLMDDYEVGRGYGFRMRLVCKPWKGRADVLAEARAFLSEFQVKP